MKTIDELQKELDDIKALEDQALANDQHQIIEALSVAKHNLLEEIAALQPKEEAEEAEKEEEAIDAPFRRVLLLIEVNKDDIKDEIDNYVCINDLCYRILHSSQI